MGVMTILNVRIRTEVLDGGIPRALPEVFASPWELDIRARAYEQNHEQLETMEVGQSLDWEYQGYTFRTTIIEKRPPEEI